MSLVIGIILALVVFFLVVFIHELGHFLTARWSGVKVLEFGLGIPPKIFRFFRDKKWTDWTINWLPIGGFVRLKGENFDDPESKHKDALPQAAWWKQVIILLAGVFMNFLLAGLLFSTLFFIWTQPLTVHVRELAPHSLLSKVGSGTQLIPIFNTVQDAKNAGVLRAEPGLVLDPVADAPAFEAGIKSGDVLLSIDGVEVQTLEDLTSRLWTNVLTFQISRAGELQDISVTPEEGKIGAYIAPHVTLEKYDYGILDSLEHGFLEVYRQIGFSLRTFGAIIRTTFSDTASEEEKEEATSGIGWPVAIGRVFVGMADYGIEWRSIITLTALISLSLWVFNLLPFPALDGGRCLVVLVNQWIHLINPKYKISPKVEQIIHSLGFMLLIVASILVTWKDIFFH